MKKIFICLFVLAALYSAGAQNPYEAFGCKGNVLQTEQERTGNYNYEIFNADSSLKIQINLESKRIVVMDKTENIVAEGRLVPLVVKKWLSRDPLANKFPSMSPYNGFDNNPILFVDPDGRNTKIPTQLFHSSTTGPYPAGYNAEGLNMQDWNMIQSEVYNKSGITLAEPKRTDTHFRVDGITMTFDDETFLPGLDGGSETIKITTSVFLPDIDEAVGSVDARAEFLFYFDNPAFSLNCEIRNSDPGIYESGFKPDYIFDASGNIIGMNYNSSILILDLDDFRNCTYSGVDPAAYSLGTQLFHEFRHGRADGEIGFPYRTARADIEIIEAIVIAKTNQVRKQLGLHHLRVPTYKNFFETSGGIRRQYIPFYDTKSTTFPTFGKVYVP